MSMIVVEEEVDVVDDVVDHVEGQGEEEHFFDDEFEREHPMQDMADLNSDQVNRQRKTASNHFRKFCIAKNYEERIRSVDSFPEEILQPSVSGEFSTFLKDKVNSIRKWTSTHDQYVSCIFCMMTEKYPLKCLGWANYYKRLRRNIFKHYARKASNKQEDLIEHKTLPETDDMEYVCYKLFEGGADTAYPRSIILCEYVFAGRDAEVRFGSSRWLKASLDFETCVT